MFLLFCLYFNIIINDEFFRYLCINIGVAPITMYTHVRNKTSNTQESSPNVVKSDFPYLKELLLKERIRSLWEPILSFKRSSHFKKGFNYRESLLDTVVSL